MNGTVGLATLAQLDDTFPADMLCRSQAVAHYAARLEAAAKRSRPWDQAALDDMALITDVLGVIATL